MESLFSTSERKMLLDLFHLYAPSRSEKPVLDFIKEILKANNIPYVQDTFGNIICLNHKKQPILSAHTDCVGGLEDGHYVNLIDIYKYGEEEILKGIGNIGGDDKCGVFLILLYLISGKPINAFFSVEEEIGGFNGITKILEEVKDDKIFKSVPYCLVLDRKNWGDIICHNNNYGSKKFEDAIAELGKEYYYKPCPGGSSDANKIKEYMNCCNLSVSYYNPHSSTEYVSLTDLYNTWMFVNEIIEKLPRNIPLEKQQPVTTYQSSYSNYSGLWSNEYTYW